MVPQKIPLCSLNNSPLCEMYSIIFVVGFFLSCTSAKSKTGQKVPLFKLEGEVNGQEFVYYKIMHPGNLLLMLESVEGDADIYISEKTSAPTYHPENYDLHSATCGSDSVTISKNLKRPMAVGIYGYSPYTRFILEVYQLSEVDNGIFFYEDEDVNEVEMNEAAQEKKERKSSSKVKRKLKTISNGLWPFLEIFEMFFL